MGMKSTLKQSEKVRVQVDLTATEVTPPLTGATDEVHFFHAQATKRVILTKNPADFSRLHQQFSDHAGILAVYQDNDPSRDMSYADIVRDIANLEQTGISISSEFWSLNAYQW
jgi:hypothetical protein